MLRAERLLPLILLLLLLLPSATAQAEQGVVGRLGIGVSGYMNYPILSLKDRFRATESWGTFLTYAKGPHATVEVEYHRSRFDPGKLEQSTFYWPENNPAKWRRVKSPLARNYMAVDAFTINGLYHFVDRSAADPNDGKSRTVAGPYMAYGGGFYHYVNAVSGLIFSGQPDLGAGIDETLVLEPFEDTEVAWGFHVGAGVEVLINHSTGFDIRGRYHLMVGELRELQAYGMTRSYPMHYFDFGISMKYYIGKPGRRSASK